MSAEQQTLLPTTNLNVLTYKTLLKSQRRHFNIVQQLSICGTLMLPFDRRTDRSLRYGSIDKSSNSEEHPARICSVIRTCWVYGRISTNGKRLLRTLRWRATTKIRFHYFKGSCSDTHDHRQNPQGQDDGEGQEANVRLFRTTLLDSSDNQESEGVARGEETGGYPTLSFQLPHPDI